VGDSLGMTMLGYNGTTRVTMDEMIHHIKPVVKGAPHTFIVGDMPFGSYNASIEQAVMNASRMMKEGECDSIKLEGGVEIISQVEAIIRGGIPVMGHIGLTPQTVSQFGGFKVQGGTPESAKKIIDDAIALEKAGVFSIVVECVPKGVGKAITEAVKIPVLGIGAGPYVDCQVMVFQDMMGMYNGFKPKFVKQYAQIRQEMIQGLNQFHTETISGEFPSEEYCFNKEVTLNGIYGKE